MHVALDFETFFSKKLKYSLATQIAEEYCRSPHFDCYLVSVSDGIRTWSGSPKNFNWEALHGRVLVSHNRYWDNTCFNRLQELGQVPAHIKPAEWHCTANLTAFLCNRRSLADAIEGLYKARVDKSYRLVAEGKRWPQDYTEEEQKKVIEAGKIDAQWCWKLWEDFSGKWSAMERRLSNITIEQGMHGVQIDRALLDQYIIQTHEAKMNNERLIPWMQDDPGEEWDEFNCKPTSSKCIAEQCRKKGIPCPPLKSVDEEAYEEWETQYGPRHPWIKAVSAWRSVNKLYATFMTVKRRLRPDNTLPFALKYFGAHTGRWSGDAKINFQNMRKKPLFVNQQGLMEDNEAAIQKAMDEKDETSKWPEWVRYAIDFRALILPRPGLKMVASDLAQIEPRVLAYIGKNHQLLKAIGEGYGVYEAFARANMGVTGPRWTKEIKKSDFYKMIKIQVLGLGYGAGWRKFINICWNEGGIDITKDDPEFVIDQNPFSKVERKVSGYGKTSREIVAKFRESVPYITNLWHSLEGQLRGSVGGDLIINLPSGRKLRYEKVVCSVTIEQDEETKKPKRVSKYTAEVGGIRKPYYGGKLTENVAQAIARDVLAWQICEMDRQGLPSLFSCHDEDVLEVDPSVSAKDIEHQMSQCPEWLKGCPLAAEAKELAHYEK
jgi:hypothetical protein